MDLPISMLIKTNADLKAINYNYKTIITLRTVSVSHLLKAYKSKPVTIPL